MTTIQDRIIKRFDKLTDTTDCPDELYGAGSATEWLKKNKTLYSDEVYGEPMFDLCEDKVKQFLIQSIKEVEEKTRKEMIEHFRNVFNDWAGDSQYVTGSWNSGESDFDSEKEGDVYWDWWKKTAWEQFYDYYKLSIINKEK